MSPHARFPLISVEISRDDIAVESMNPSKVPDAKWRYVDKQGHGHFWDGYELPTLEWVVTGTEWAGDEYDGIEVEIGEWRCRQCAEVVEPQRRLEYGSAHVPGLTWITVTIDRESFVLSPEEYTRSIEAWAEALRKRRP